MKTCAFCIPIFKYKVDNWKIKKKKLLNLFNNFHTKIIDNVITTPFDIKSNIFCEEIKLFEKEVNLKFSVSEFWFQRYNNGMDHAPHNHGPVGFSAVCYLEFDRKYHKPTIFISPLGNFINGEIERYIPQVEEGEIIFFPSNLLHFAPVNLSNKIRIIVSFNLEINNNNEFNKINYI
jgi:hypothetical protein